MKKMIIISTVIFGVLIFCGLYCLNIALQGLEEQKTAYGKKIGATIIFQKDTLTVVDYSTVNETFTLSNGKVVDKQLILKTK